MTTTSRMPCEERKEKILAAVRKIFSQKEWPARPPGIGEGSRCLGSPSYKHYPVRKPSIRPCFPPAMAASGGKSKKILRRAFHLHADRARSFLVSALFHHKVPDLKFVYASIFKASWGRRVARFMMKQKMESCSIIPRIADSVRAAIASGDWQSLPCQFRCALYS